MYKQFHISKSCYDGVSRTAIITPQCVYWYLGRHCSEEIQFLISKRLKVPAFSLEENPPFFYGFCNLGCWDSPPPGWDEAWDARGTVIL